MDWKGSSVMDERCRFVLEAKSKGANISEICRRYGVSRKTGYKWLRRHEQEGRKGQCVKQGQPADKPRSTAFGNNAEARALASAESAG